MGEYHVVEELIPGVRDSLKRIEDALQVRAPARPGEVTFTAQGVQPPTQFYVTQDFQIRVRSVTSQTAEVLTVTANILVDNRVVPVSTSSLPFTNAVNTTTLRVPVTGFLVSCSLQAAVATVRCDTYALVELLDQNGTFQNTLFAGYVTMAKSLSYPPITVEDPFSGYGKMVGVAPTVFAAGNVFCTCPANRVQILRGLQEYWVSGVGVANRTVNVYYQLTSGAFLYIYSSTVQVASQTWWYSAAQNIGQLTVLSGATNIGQFAIPELYLRAGDVVGFQANNFIGPGDALTDDIWTFEEWLTL